MGLFKINVAGIHIGKENKKIVAVNCLLETWQMYAKSNEVKDFVLPQLLISKK